MLPLTLILKLLNVELHLDVFLSPLDNDDSKPLQNSNLTF